MYVLSEEGGATQKAYEDVEGGGGGLFKDHMYAYVIFRV